MQPSPTRRRIAVTLRRSTAAKRRSDMQQTRRPQIRSGWVTFAAIVAGVVGVYNVLSGIAAIAEDDDTERVAEVLYGIDITAWGWFWLILGIVQLVVAWLIYTRHPLGQMLGLIWAFINASLSVFLIFAEPLWALGMLGINLLVIYALIVNTEEFDNIT
jgi:hypothetical protein